MYIIYIPLQQLRVGRGSQGVVPPVKIFPGRQKLHVMTQERLSEIQNLGKLKNYSTLFSVFTSRKREWPRWQEHFNCLSLPVV